MKLLISLDFSFHSTYHPTTHSYPQKEVLNEPTVVDQDYEQNQLNVVTDVH